MYPRTNYEMTEEDLKEILDSSKPTPCMMIGSYTPATPQENANRAWQSLGKKMGFDHMTVRPIEGKGQRFFSAVPSETEEQKTHRLKQDAEVKRLSEISKLENEIVERQIKLNDLRKNNQPKI